MSSLAPPGGPAPSAPAEPSGPSPAGVAGLVHERLVVLASTYERTADELMTLAGELRTAQTPDWKGQAAQTYRHRLDELVADLQGAARQYRNVAAELRAGAAGLSGQIGAAEQFLDLGTLGASVLGVLAHAGQSIPQHGLGGLLR